MCYVGYMHVSVGSKVFVDTYYDTSLADVRTAVAYAENRIADGGLRKSISQWAAALSLMQTAGLEKKI